MNKKLDIKIFVMPVGACIYEKSWQPAGGEVSPKGGYVVDLVSKKLKERLGDVFDMKLIEIFSTESFSYKEILEGIQQEKLQTPVVTINGGIVQSGGKLSEKILREKMEHR